MPAYNQDWALVGDWLLFKVTNMFAIIWNLAVVSPEGILSFPVVLNEI